MSIKYILFALLGVSFFTGVAQGKVPGSRIKKAQKAYFLGDYELAVSRFKDILAIDEDNYSANYELGRIYLKHYNYYDSAVVCFEKTIENPIKDTIFETYFDYASALQLKGDYRNAIDNYTLFKSIGLKNNSFAELLEVTIDKKIKECNYAISEAKSRQKKSVLVKNMESKTNTKRSEYASVYLKKANTLLYTTRYKDLKKEKKYKDSRYFENEYILNLDSSKSGVKLNGSQLKEIRKKHNSFVSKSFGEDTIVLYRENKLWYSILNKGNFTKPVLFDESINFAQYQPHGVFSKDGQTFIFSSNSKEGKGGLDLYESQIKNGKWSKAQPLSGLINTKENEDSPFLSESGDVLYFSSKGHEGFGAYDVFKSVKENGEWTKPINLGMPINSPADDIYLSINKEENKGYLSSNRFGGKGAMDIYYLEDFAQPRFDCDLYVNKPFTVTFDLSKSLDNRSSALDFKWNFENGIYKYGTIVKHSFKYPGTYNVSLDIIDKESGKIEHDEQIEEIKIEDVDFVGVKMNQIGEVGKNQHLDASVTSLKGKEIRNCFWKINEKILPVDTVVFDTVFNEIGWHQIKINIVSFDDSLATFETFCQEDSIRILSAEDYLRELEKEKLSIDSSNNDLLSSTVIDSLLTKGAGFKLNPVYFHFDKSYLTKQARVILDDNISKLKENRNAYIIIKGHTDAMGENSYNEKLSARRSVSVVKYLQVNGVEKARIVEVQNFGESKPAAPNTTENGLDSPKGRKLNRRVEFQIIKSK